MAPVTEEEAMSEVRTAVRRYKAAQKRLEQAHTELRAVLRAASEEGVKQARLVEITGYTREHVRRLLLPEDGKGTQEGRAADERPATP